MQNKKTTDEVVEQMPASMQTEETKSVEVIGSPLDLKKDLPLVVHHSDADSPAQTLYKHIINAYAYQNAKKFEAKKADFLKRLSALAGKDIAETDKRLIMNIDGRLDGSRIDFQFMVIGGEYISTLPDVIK